MLPGRPRGQIAQLATIPVIFPYGYGGSQDASILLPVGFLKFRQDTESEADRMAVSITAAAGYDPEGLARYIGRVQQDSAQRSLFQAYPLRDERVQAIEQAIQALPVRTYESSGDFAEIQEELRRAVPPAPPKPRPTLQR